MQQLQDWINEYQLLGVAVVLGFVQLSWAAIAARTQQGLKWARGPRDEHKPVTGIAGRLERAFRNYMETFPLFAVAAFASMLTDTKSALASQLVWWGSLTYVLARIVYVPLCSHFSRKSSQCGDTERTLLTRSQRSDVRLGGNSRQQTRKTTRRTSWK